MNETRRATSLPTVWVTPSAKERLDLMIELADGEISGLGTVTRAGNDFLITEVHLFDQVCTSASTDLSAEDVGNFLLESIRDGLDPAELKLWWHSHATMGVFWSGTDESTAGSFGNGWMLSVVGNKRGEYLARLDLYEPFRLTLAALEFREQKVADPNLREAVKAEVQAKVKRPALPASFTGGLGQGFSKRVWESDDDESRAPYAPTTPPRRTTTPATTAPKKAKGGRK